MTRKCQRTPCPTSVSIVTAAVITVTMGWNWPGARKESTRLERGVGLGGWQLDT